MDRKIISPSACLPPVLDQILAGGGHGKLSMLNTSGTYQPISDLLNYTPFSFNNTERPSRTGFSLEIITELSREGSTEILFLSVFN